MATDQKPDFGKESGLSAYGSGIFAKRGRKIYYL